VPDFCFLCSEYYGASISAGLFGESGPSIAFVVDEKGEIQPFDSPFTGDLITPSVQYNGSGNFSMTWTENDSYQKPYITITTQGQVTPSGGSGTWSYEYEGVGTLYSGPWKMEPSSY
jgi:hypothetical protein